MESLHRKSASTAEFRKFKMELKKIVAKGHILDYELKLDGDGQMLVIKRMKHYLLNAEEKRKRKIGEEAIKKSKDILHKSSKVADVEEVEESAMKMS